MRYPQATRHPVGRGSRTFIRKFRPNYWLVLLATFFGSVAFYSLSLAESNNPGLAVLAKLKAVASANAPVPDQSASGLPRGRAFKFDFRGDQGLVDAFKSGTPHARSLASADFDSDGAPDVVVGYELNGVGVVGVLRGNSEAFAPRDESIYPRLQQGYNPDSLLPSADIYQAAVPADFLAAGDFNQDGKPDVVMAARGSGLYLLAGDGQGGLLSPEQVALPGQVVALTAGEFGVFDGRPDLAIAVNGPDGPALLIFDGAAPGLSQPTVNYRLQNQPTDVAFGRLDEDAFADTAISTSEGVEILHGWSRNKNVVLASQFERISVAGGVASLSLANYVWDRESRNELAALSSDGTVYLMEQPSIDKRRFTEAELAQRAELRRAPRVKTTEADIDAMPHWEAGRSRHLSAPRNIRLRASVNQLSGTRALGTLQSRGETDDLLLLDHGQKKLNIVHEQTPRGADSIQAETESISVENSVTELAVAPVATLALPREINGKRSLLILSGDNSDGIIIEEFAQTGIAVDTTADDASKSACTGAVNDCSLRGAVTFANNNAGNPEGTAITLGTNTYSLTIPNGTSGCDSNTTGDLAVNRSTSFIGNGPGSTIIAQTAATQRVMCLNLGFTNALAYSFSGLAIVNGRDVTGVGGGAVVGGADNNTHNFDNVLIANNQSSDASCPGVCTNTGGGGINIYGGSLTIQNSTVGGSTIPTLGSANNVVNTTTANMTNSSGGGIAYSPGLITPGTSGTLTVSNTTVQNNRAGSTSAGGGGADLTNVNGGIGSFLFNLGTTFTGNSATNGNGGAVHIGSFELTLDNATFTGNTAPNTNHVGGAIRISGGGLKFNSTTSFSGNTANVTAANCLSVDSGGTATTGVHVTGTGNNINDNVQIEDGGFWDNANGTSVTIANLTMVEGTFTGNSGTLNVTGNLTLANGGTGDTNSFTGGSGAHDINGNLSIADGTYTATSGITTLAGNFTNSGTFAHGSGTFTFDGTGAQTISGTPTFNILNVNKSSGTLTLLSNISIANNLSVLQGTFDLSTFTSNRTAAGGTLTVSNGTTLKLGGTSGGQTGSNFPLNFSTISLGSTSTVDYSAAGSQTIFATPTYGNLNTSGSGTKTAGNGLTIAGNVTIGTGTVFAGSTFTHNLAGNWVNNVGASGFTSSGAGTVNFNGTGAQSVTGQTTFNNLTLTKTAGQTLTLNSAITLNGNLLLTSGNLSAGANSISVAGNWTNNSSATAFTGTNTTTFTGGTSNTIGGTFSTAFNSLTVNKSGGTLSLSTNITIAGDLSVSAGTFDLSTFTANRTGLGGTLTVSNGAALTIGGTNVFPSNYSTNTLGTTSTTNYNGTNQNVAAVTYGNLSLSGAGTKTLLGTTTIAGNLTLASGTTLDTASNNISIAGDWTNNGGTFIPGTNTVTFTGNSSAINGSATAQTFNNITVNKNAGQPLGIGLTTTTLNVGGNLLVSTGTFQQSATALNLTGNLTISLGATYTKAVGGQAFTFNRTTVGGQSWTDNTASIQDMGVVVIGGTSNVVTAGSAVKATSLTVNSGDTFFINGNSFSFTAAAAVVNNGTVRLRGPETLTNVNNLDVDSGLVEYVGNNTVGPFAIKDFGAGTDYFNLTIVDVNATEATYNVASNLTVANNLTITSGTLAGGSSTISVGGNWANSDTFTAGTSTVVLNGNNNTQTISGNNAFNNLTINHTGTGNVTASGSTLAVTALMRVQGGTFITSSTFNNVQIDAGTTLQSDGTTINVTGNWTNNGTFTHSNGTVIFNGTGTQALSGSSNTLFNTLTLANTAAAISFTSSQSAAGNLTVNSGAILSPAAAAVIGGAGTLTGAGKVEVTRTAATPDFLSQYTITNKTLTNLTVDYTSTGAQTVNNLNYNNLTISGARTTNSVTLAAGTVGVSNVFAPNATFTSGGYVKTGNTFDFNGAGLQTIPAFNYLNLTSSNAGARTLASAGVIGIAGAFTPGTNSYTITNSTVEYNGSGVAQNLPSIFTTYNNLNLNNPAGTVGFAGLTVQAQIQVKSGTFTSSSTYNNVLIDAGATLAASPASTISVSGTWTNNGSFTPNDGVVIFNGGALQNIAGTSPTTFNSLTINNSAGVVLGINATVNGVLNLAVGDLNTSTFTLTMPAAASSTGVTDVVGNVKRTGFVSGGAALSFGNPFNTISIQSGTAPTDINVNLVKSSPAAFASAVQRTYTITPNGGSGISATLRLHYLDSELNGNTEAQLDLWRFDGATFVDEGQTGRNSTDNWVEKSGVAAFSPWTLADFVAPTAPVANDDNYSTFKNTQLNIAAPGVLTNDTGSPTVSGVGGCADVTAPFENCATTAGGEVDVNADGSFSYTPLAGYVGADSFGYTATNGGGSDTATVNITVSDSLFINEVLFDPPSTDAPHEYLEFRGAPSATIPAGTYLVAIEGDSADNAGDIQTIINLSGLTFGTNGFLVLLQNSEPYSTASGANIITSTSTGFGGLPGSIWSADSGATDIEDSSVTFMVIQTGTVPALTNDIDTDDNGTPDGAIFTGWTVIDSIGVLDGTATTDRAYGAINYSNNTGTPGTAPGTPILVAFTASYVGRSGDTTGSAAADWVASGALGGATPNWTLSSTQTEPIAFANQPLNHIGTTNFDISPPTVQSINRVTATPTNATSVDFLVTFSESVTGVDTGDFALTTTGGIATASVTGVTGSGATRTVSVNTGTGDGTIRLDLVDDDTILDSSNNKLGGVGAGNGSFTTGQVYTLDKSGPTVTINQASGQGDPTSTSPINFTVVFNEPVTNFVTGDVTLSGAGATTGTVTETTPNNGTTYNVAVTGMNASGTVTASLLSGVASDALGNLSQASSSTDNTVTFNFVTNNAPVLDNTGNMSLTSINEDVPNASNTGTLVGDIILSAGGDRITDADPGAVEGIAVTAVDNTNGTWEFSINNGTNWTAFGSPNATTARLLAANATTRVRFVPAANFNGTVNPGITFRAWDQTAGTNGSTADTTTNGGQTAFSAAADTASITVNAVNDPPSFTEGPDQVVGEDAGAQTVVGWATNISAGPANESGQTLTFLVATNNDSLFAVLPAISSTGTLTYTPAANASGIVTVDVSLQDNGGGTNTSAVQTFTITINAVNDTPTANAQSVNTNEDTPLGITLTGSDPETPSGSLLFTVTVQPTNGVLSGSGANRTYTPNAGYNGPDSFKFTVTDTGTPALTSAEASVSITVDAVNDGPTNTVPGAQATNTNTALIFSAGNGNQISIADSDAGVAAVQVTLTATNGTVTLSTAGGLVFSVGDSTAEATMTFSGSVANINNALNGLAFTPTSGFSGAASLQIVTNDQGNTGSGGALSDTDSVNITVTSGGTLQFSSATYTVAENGGPATITITRAGGSAGTATVLFQTSNGTADSGDYTPVSQTVTFVDGDTSETVNVPITNDTDPEADQTVNLTLSNAGGTGTLGAPSTAILTITNDDIGGTLQFSGSTYNVAENAGPAVITITRTGGASGTATVLFQTSNGTADSGDYTTVSETVTFLNGETSKTVNVPITNDTDNEPNQTVNLTLSNVGGTGALGTPATAVLTIENDDQPKFVFAVNSYNVGEAGPGLTVTVNRTGDPNVAATVDVATNDFMAASCNTVAGTASAKCDYATAGGRLRFGAGQTSRTVVLSIVDDVFVEGNETLTMALSNPTAGSALGTTSTTTITIQDNDSNPNAANPFPQNPFFVRMQYLDFLLREPDTSGFNDWLNVLNTCQPNQGFLGSSPACDRVHVSSGFFRSTEFGERGYWVYRFFEGSLGRRPTFEEFTPEMRRLSGLKPAADLDQDEADFINEFMARAEFTAKYAGLTNAAQAAQFVAALEQTAGVTLPATVPPTQPGQPPQYGRQELINLMSAGTLTPAQTLRAFIEQKVVWDKNFFKAFVAMQYFGYLRRNPDTAGYNDWLDVLTNGRPALGIPPGDFRHLVFGFVYSVEYRERFGQP